ncbi:MAG: exo-alpha-sialidase, partial [Anaerolineales bacterium]
MIKRIFSLNASLLIILMLIGVLFGFIPRSHAQTVQDWSEPINLSGSGAGSNPSMVIDSHGVLHVLWVDKFEGYKYTESPDGLTWSSPVTVKFPFSLEQILPPVFLADPKGVIHIFWLTEKNDLFYAQTLDENLAIPAGWRMVSKRDSSVFDFDLDIDAQGRLHLGYVKNPIPVADSRGIVVPLPATSKAGVFYQLSNDGGTRWTTPGLLYESPYFRSLTSQNARIRIAASPTGDGAKVYAVWDDQAQKRIFMATSVDGGLNWSSARELISPQATLGFKTPYHADIDVLQDKVLVTWQIGDPGVQCTPYSWVSSNGGESWEEPVKILDEIAGCPEKSEFLPIDPNYSVILLTLQDDLSISAWNNIQWSHPEIQLGPSSITNPSTFDTVSLGCEQAQAYQNQLFVVGCDQGSGGDIWFMSRQLQPLETLFPLPSAWGKDANVATATETMTSLVSVADAANNVHVLWIQSSSSLTDPVDPRIEYSRWNGKEWTKASPVITDLPGLPLNLTVQIDTQQRLLLSWIDQPTGELLFSWASSERANVPVEWIKPVVMTSSSQVTNSPDMLVDASDRIMLAYAITVNEDRGVYVIQSGDLGSTWSPPVRVFDAMSANWEMVDQPQLAVTQDGKLHILFTQYTLLGSQQAVGLNYSQSMDGGLTWTAPLMVNQHPVEWSEILAFKQTLHRFWQEKDQVAISTYHQVSVDGG